MGADRVPLVHRVPRGCKALSGFARPRALCCRRAQLLWWLPQLGQFATVEVKGRGCQGSPESGREATFITFIE